MNQQKIIITINRECGSGGGEMARLLGQKLGIKVYDRTILERIAKQYNMTVESMDRVKAKNPHWWDDICNFYQQFGSFQTGEKPSFEATPMILYSAEARLLREVAEKESCILVGRVGFHIFQGNPDALHVLIIADRDARINRIATKQNLTPKEAAKVVDRIDKERNTFVKHVADVSRFDAHNYDLVLNVTGMTPEKVVAFLEDYIQLKKKG